MESHGKGNAQDKLLTGAGNPNNVANLIFLSALIWRRASYISAIFLIWNRRALVLWTTGKFAGLTIHTTFSSKIWDIFYFPSSLGSILYVEKCCAFQGYFSLFFFNWNNIYQVTNLQGQASTQQPQLRGSLIGSCGGWKCGTICDTEKHNRDCNMDSIAP